MAASIVSRKMMKKMETEKRSFAILKDVSLWFNNRFLWGLSKR